MIPRVVVNECGWKRNTLTTARQMHCLRRLSVDLKTHLTSVNVSRHRSATMRIICVHQGYELYGSPAIASDGKRCIVAQAVVLRTDLFDTDHPRAGFRP